MKIPEDITAAVAEWLSALSGQGLTSAGAARFVEALDFAVDTDHVAEIIQRDPFIGADAENHIKALNYGRCLPRRERDFITKKSRDQNPGALRYAKNSWTREGDETWTGMMEAYCNALLAMRPDAEPSRHNGLTAAEEKERSA